MPTREAIVDSIIPREVEKPLPVRTVSTRSLRPKLEDRDQENTVKEKLEAAVESPPPAESVRLSPQLTALARKEQAFRQREQALKEKETGFGAKLSLADKYEQLQKKLAAKDFSELESMGVDYEGYTSYLLNKQNGEKPEDAKFKTIEEEIAALKKSQEENTTKQFEATVGEYRKEIAAYVGSAPGFEGLKDPENQKAILQLILDDFEKDGTETSIEQAAKDVKEYLAEQAKKLSVFLEKPKVEEQAQAEKPKQLPPPTKTQGLKTLTQQVNTGATEAPLKSLQHMSESERYAEARRRAIAKREAAMSAQGKR